VKERDTGEQALQNLFTGEREREKDREKERKREGEREIQR
jgi:hypothetical protein